MTAKLITALQDCVIVMERDLNGLAVIQPELQQAREALASLAKSADWAGEGLPPVGLVLEYMWNYKQEGSEYVQVEILVHDKGSAIMRTLDGPDPGVLRESRGGYCGPGRGQPIFRAIRTPEQIAEEEREKAVAAMLELDPYLPNTTLGMMSRADFCRTLHDAGYRKVEGSAD